MTITKGMRVRLARKYTRGRDMETFLTGEAGTVEDFTDPQTAVVRMDDDGFVYPFPVRVLARAST